MPQIVSGLLNKLDRKRLLIAASVAVVGLCGWCLIREKPRTVEDDAWENIVFPEMDRSNVTGVSPQPTPMPETAARETVTGTTGETRGMAVEVAANVPLFLDRQSPPAAPPPPARPEVNSQVIEPIRLGGGIEPVEAATY